MRLAFDIKQMRPACVLLAAAMGADPAASKRFDSETWLLAPTEDMKVYAVTEEQLAQIVQRTEQHHQTQAETTA